MQPASGARDLNPQQVEINHLIGSKLSNVFKLWGYEELSPPYIERLETLMAGDAIANKDILKVVSDESLGLRPEMTTSIARAASTRLKEKARPLRLWAKGTIFKNKEVGEGLSYIEESQETGIELFGIKSISAEIELLSLLLESLKSLNLNKSLKPTLLIGNTELMRLILSKYDHKIRNRIKSILINLDQIAINELDLNSISKAELVKINKCRGIPNKVINDLEGIYGKLNILEEVRLFFKTIEPISKRYNIDIQLDPTFTPNFDLYNGFIFQLVCKSNNNQVIIAKGGRYDKVVSIFSKESKDASGVGFSYAIDNIRELLIELDLKEYYQERVLIAYDSKNKIDEVLDIQRSYHDKGQIALIELEACTNKDAAIKLMSKRKCSKLHWC